MDLLLQRAKDGDDDAWRQLVAQHSTALLRYLDRRMGSQLRRACSTSDLSQDVLTRVFHALRSAPADATQRTFRRWMYRHADWVLANHGHASRRHFGESKGNAPDEVLSDPTKARTTGDVTHRDQVEWMRALLDRLDPKHAEVVRLRLDGLSFAAISSRLGLEEAAVRQRLSRVLRVLAEMRTASG